ncbi:MAG: hypothetical protein L3J95_01710 [Thermoplasmata archaeon]|nr:hypothetical protein [Thermoplasmata archaeon]MCI4359129.1 hypothetical protein [Thermoplasmata archaeon]
MTICIAAICNNGKSVVVAADRMFTSPPPVSVEFESDVSKIEWFAPGIVVLPAGNVAVVTEILDEARKELGGNGTPTVVQAAEAVHRAYERVKLTKAEEQIILPMLGIDFYNARKVKGALLPQYLQPQPQLYQLLAAQTSQYNLQTELVLAGVDANGARIAVVTHPGSIYWLDKLGYGAVGSGAIHAITTMALSGQTRTHALYDTVYGVYCAKVAAHVAPGVGQTTDLAVVAADGSPRVCSDAVLEELKKAREQAMMIQRPSLKELQRVYESEKPH